MDTSDGGNSSGDEIINKLEENKEGLGAEVREMLLKYREIKETLEQAIIHMELAEQNKGVEPMHDEDPPKDKDDDTGPPALKKQRADESLAKETAAAAATATAAAVAEATAAATADRKKGKAAAAAKPPSGKANA
jgi:hypothetical protein